MTQLTRRAAAFPLGQKWDAAVLLGIGVVALVLRLPMAMEALGALSVIVLGLQGIVWRKGFGLLWAFFGVAIVASGIALVRHPVDVAGGYVVMMGCFALFALAVCQSGNVARNVTIVLRAVYIGLWVHFVISMTELLSGIKLLPLRNPKAGTVPMVLTDPWIVNSLFTNYNDYSVAMVIFVNLLMARLLFARSQPVWRTVTQLIALVSTTVVIVMIGSRGAMLAYAATFAVQIIITTRFNHKHLLSTARVWAMIGVGFVGLALAWNTPYFQNHSTQWREQIIQRIIDLTVADPERLLFGYGSKGWFDAVADLAWPKELLDPHNMFVELIIAAGIVPVLLFVLALVFVFLRGFMGQQVAMSPVGLAAITTGLGLVVYGTVPSSYLNYGYPFIFLVTSWAAIWLARAGSGSASLAAASVDDHEQDCSRSPNEQGSAADHSEPCHR